MPLAYVMLENNDMLVEVDKLQDSSDDTFVNAATVTAVLKDSDGVNVTGQSMPISLSYVSASDGKYQGIFDSVVNLDDGDTGTVEITAVQGTLDAFWELSFTCRRRQV